MNSKPPDREYPVKVIIGSLIAGVFFGGVGGGVAFPTLPMLGAVLGISPLFVGLILSINRVTRLILNTPAGQIIDKVGVRKPMILGFVFQGLAPFGYILGLNPEYVPVIGSVEIFLIARIIWGIGSALVFVGAFSTVVKITTEDNRGKWVGYFRGGQSLGLPTGLILGGLLTDFFSFEVAFGTAGVLGFVAGLVAIIVLPDLSPSPEKSAGIFELPSVIRSDPRIVAIGSVNFTVRFLFAGILLSTVVLYAEQNNFIIREFSEIGISGFVMALAVIFSSATTVIAGNISDRINNRPLITLPAFAFLIFGFALLSAVPTLPTTLIAVAAIGVGVGGTTPPLLAYLGDISAEEDMGKMGGIYNAFGDLGSATGPMIALPVAELIGLRAGYLACAGFAVLAAMLVLKMLVWSNPVATSGRVESS